MAPWVAPGILVCSSYALMAAVSSGTHGNQLSTPGGIGDTELTQYNTFPAIVTVSSRIGARITPVGTSSLDRKIVAAH